MGGVGEGTQLIRWDLTSVDESPVAPGVYLLRLEAETPQASDVRRLAVVR